MKLDPRSGHFSISYSVLPKEVVVGGWRGEKMNYYSASIEGSINTSYMLCYESETQLQDNNDHYPPVYPIPKLFLN